MKQVKISSNHTQPESITRRRMMAIHPHAQTHFKPLTKKFNKLFYVTESTLLVLPENLQKYVFDFSKKYDDGVKRLSQYTSIKNFKGIKHLNLDISELDKLSSTQQRLFHRMVKRSSKSLTNLSLVFEKPSGFRKRGTEKLNYSPLINSIFSTSCRNLKHLSINYHYKISDKQFLLFYYLLTRKLRHLKTIKLDFEGSPNLDYPPTRLFPNRLSYPLSNLSLALPKFPENNLKGMPISRRLLKKVQVLDLKISSSEPCSFPETQLNSSDSSLQNRLCLVLKEVGHVKNLHDFSWLQKNFLDHARNLRFLALHFQRLNRLTRAKVEQPVFLNLDNLPHLEEVSLDFDYSESILINALNGIKLSSSDHKLRKLSLKMCTYQPWTNEDLNDDDPENFVNDGDDAQRTERSFDSGTEDQEAEIAVALRGFCMNTLSKLQNLVDLQVEFSEGWVTKRFIVLITNCAMSLGKLENYSLSLAHLQRFSAKGMKELQEALIKSPPGSLQDLTIALSFCTKITEKGVGSFREALAGHFSELNSVRVIFEDNRTDSEWSPEDEEEEEDDASQDEDNEDMEYFDYSPEEEEEN